MHMISSVSKLELKKAGAQCNLQFLMDYELGKRKNGLWIIMFKLKNYCVRKFDMIQFFQECLEQYNHC